MQSVGSFFSTVSKLYSEINPATLSGAIDIVVVEQSNGDLACSPFHVRFGKLSILRPQEKVVEVTVNGRVVDFPMKVGDAGEAFFVFETEQEVPEEFATSPLAGPSQSKSSEDEIDFLDLAQGGSASHPTAAVATPPSPPDEMDTGYVSAHSGHGTEFDEEEHEVRSPLLNSRRDYTAVSETFGLFDLSGRQPMRPRHLQLEGSVHSSRSRFSYSMSLPSSPLLKAQGQDIMDNFEPIDSAGPFEEGADAQGNRRYLPSTPAASEGSHTGEFQTPHRDLVIMDMTGYKTDDSAETDLDSDEPTEPGSSSTGPRIRRMKRSKKRQPRFLPFSAIHDPDLAPGMHESTAESDSRLPTRPIQHHTDRAVSGAPIRKRSSSLPAVLGQVERSARSKLALPRYAPPKGEPPMPQYDQHSSRPGSSTAATAATSPNLDGLHHNHQGKDHASPQRLHRSHHHHHHHQHHKHQEGLQGDPNHKHPRRHSHHNNPSQHVQTKKPAARPNPAVNALSDTELEYQTPRAQDPEWTWGWGSLPVKNDSIDDMTDSDLLSPHSRHVSLDMPSTPKPVLNEMDIDGVIYKVAISLCPGDDFGKDLVASEALFATNQITFEDFSRDPMKLLSNKSLVCLINDRYFTWAAAGPHLASLLLFRKPLSDATLHQLSIKDSRHLSELTDDRSPTRETPTRFGALSRWLRGSQTSPHPNAMERSPRSRSHLAPDSLDDADELVPDKEPEAMERNRDTFHGPDKEPMVRSTSMPIDSIVSIGASTPEEQESKSSNQQQSAVSHKRYAKTLRLTSDQLKSLNLKKGANTLSFSVTSSYQGKAVCSAKLFLWDHDYQVVISDIDGTITKSDALGHIFTMAGKDWTHSGVAKLYTDITNNGYHILYLTSRAIGQADYTRKYLKNVEQNNYQLPDGPVIMSPDRLMTAFHREVIMRKPEEFKMACLRDIRRLFEDRNPFYAGFGNRITDALSYRSVNVPSSRIFTIDSGGEVKLELLSTYKSSYLALNDLVNEIFPGTKQVPEFNDWNYWKQPLPTLDLPLPLPPQRSLPPLIPLDQGSSALSRLGVIRSFTNSLTSSSPLKKRPSIPTFGSTPSTPPTSHSSLLSPSPHSHLSSSPPPPHSAPAGLADRTRRLSFSLMKYGSQSASVSTSALALTPLDRNGDPKPPTYAAAVVVAAQATAAAYSSSTPQQGSRLRGLSFTSSQVHVPSGLREDHSRDVDSQQQQQSDFQPRGGSDPLEIPFSSTSPPSSSILQKASSFSVSPPQLASRLTDTVMPFLRRRQSQTEFERSTSVSPSQMERGFEVDEEEMKTREAYQRDVGFEDYPQGEEEEGEEGEGEDYDEELDLEEDLDDVELNIDAPFL